MDRTIEYDQMAQAPWYRYWSGRDEHIVWFEDIRSYIEKYKLIDLYQIARDDILASQLASSTKLGIYEKKY